MLILTLLACGAQSTRTPAPSQRPDAVPDTAVHVGLSDGQLTVDGVAIVGLADTDLTNGIHPPLLDKLSGAGTAWITAPADAEWLYVRKLFMSAREAGVGELWLGLEGADQAFGQPGPSTASINNTCKDGPLTISDVATALSLSIQTGSDGTWAIGTARFRPIVLKGEAEVAIVDLPTSCWAPTSCQIFEDGTAAACEEAIALEPLDARVPIGGEVGCLLPIIKEPGDAAAWRGQLRKVMKNLQISPDTETLLMVEAKAPWESVTSILGAFADRGARMPSLGTPLLEGHDGPPICDAPIRDAASLRSARGIWLGSQLYDAADPP